MTPSPSDAERDAFRKRLDEAILTRRPSDEIAAEFGIRSETVRKRRKMLRLHGAKPGFGFTQKTTEANNAQHQTPAAV